MIGPTVASLGLLGLFSIFVVHFLSIGHTALLQHDVGSAWAWVLLAVLAILPAVPVALLALGATKKVKSRGITALPGREPTSRGRLAFGGFLILIYPAVALLRATIGRDLTLIVVPVVSAVWWLFLAATASCVRLASKRFAR